MPAPTLGGPAAPQGNGAPAAPAIPFTRASRQKSRLVGQFQQAVSTSLTALSPIQIPAAGYLRKLRLEVTGTTSGNAASVAFQNDAPFNILQQISLLSANGDALISPIDGFTLYLLNKYGQFGSDNANPVNSPVYSVTTGTGAAGGSFRFLIDIPVEVDSRDAFCSLQNMAANQSFLLSVSLAPSTQVYSTPPTNLPTVAIRATMEYWSAPAPTNANGDPQATAPVANGSVSLIQTQTPSVTQGTTQNIQLLNVGNTVRLPIFVARDAAGQRTDADWPDVFSFYVNNDPWLYLTKPTWQDDMADAYRLPGPISATPSATALDRGVFVMHHFIKDGSAGNNVASASQNRNLWLVTGSATALNIEATTAWGPNVRSLLVIQNNIRPSSPAALYSPNWI